MADAFQRCFKRADILAVAAFSGVMLTAGIGGYPAETNILLLICGLGLFGHGGVIALNAMFQGREKLQYSSTATVVNSLFGNFLSIAVVLIWRSAWLIALIGVIASTLQLLVMCYYSRRLIPKIPRVRWEDARRQMMVGVPYFLFTVFSIVYYRIDTVMLSKMAPEPVVGWYGGACKLFEAMNFFPYLMQLNAVFILHCRCPLLLERPDFHFDFCFVYSLHLMICVSFDTQSEAKCRQEFIFVHSAMTLGGFVLDPIGNLAKRNNCHFAKLLVGV
jgi:hypothetical protein